jgi:hypothetical protein
MGPANQQSETRLAASDGMAEGRAKMCAFMAVCAAAAFASDPAQTAPPKWMGGAALIKQVQPLPTNSQPVNSPPFVAPTTPTDSRHPSLDMPSSVAPPSSIATPPTEVVPASPFGTPPVIETAAGPSWELQVDAVWLQPRWPDMELGIANRRNLGVPNGPIERLEFDPATGFKFGFHKSWGCDGAIRVEHTYLSATTHGDIYSQPGGNVTPTLTHPLGLRDVDVGIGTAHHRSNVLDLLWTQRIHTASTFDLWLEGGSRAAWLRREFDIDYAGGDAAPLARVDHELAFRGFGLCGGLAGKWRLGAGWTIDAGGRVSLLASRNETSIVETSMRGAALLADANDARTGFTPVIDLHAGVTKVIGFCTIAVGYQMQQWLGVSELLTFNDDVHVGSLDRRRGDFGMDGLYLRLGISF